MEELKIKNVYQKLQQARVLLQQKTLKKTGKNKFSGYEYFNLSDFLPVVNEIFDEIGLCSIVSFSTENAVLNIYNCEKPDEKIEFSSPSAGVELKGCHPMQNMGAIETYQRRYLYIAALEIAESDVLDATAGNQKGIIKCDNCGEIIKPYKGRSVEDMIQGSMKTYKKKLCYECCLKEKKNQSEVNSNE